MTTIHPQQQELIFTTQTRLLETLAEHTGGKIEANKFENKLSFHSASGIGTVRELYIKPGMVYTHFQLQFTEDTTLNLDIESDNPILFIYSMEGELIYDVSETQVTSLKEFQTGMLMANHNPVKITFIKDQGYNFFVIYVKNIYLLENKFKDNPHYQHNIQEFISFFESPVLGNKLYQGTYNLKIADFAEQLQHLSLTGLSQHLLIEGIINIIMGLKIQQLIDDKINVRDTFGNLTKRDCREIKKLSDLIYENPEIQYSVEYLCTQSGLSPCKLQEGFKKMHGRTVADFIRNVRVEKAELLIKTTDLNISEIVYSIGFTSRSYFSKIFKKKYKCSPKSYQTNKTIGVTA